MIYHHAILLSAASFVTASSDSPDDWVNLTVYHTNQANYSAGDIADMNTADALGDLEFTVRAKLYPLECATAELKREAPYDCTLNVQFSSSSNAASAAAAAAAASTFACCMAALQDGVLCGCFNFCLLHGCIAGWCIVRMLQLLPAAWLHCRMVCIMRMYCCSFRTETLSRSAQIIMLTWALLPMPMTSS